MGIIDDAMRAVTGRTGETEAANMDAEKRRQARLAKVPQVRFEAEQAAAQYRIDMEQAQRASHEKGKKEK